MLLLHVILCKPCQKTLPAAMHVVTAAGILIRLLDYFIRHISYNNNYILYLRNQKTILLTGFNCRMCENANVF